MTQSAKQVLHLYLVRAREDGVRECRNARHRLKALLLRSGIAYAGKSAWTAAHLRWLSTLKMEHAAQQIEREPLLENQRQREPPRPRAASFHRCRSGPAP